MLHHKNDMLTLPKSNHIQRLQCRDDVLGLNSCHQWNVLDLNVLIPRLLRKHSQQNMCPITSVWDFPQITQWLLRWSRFPLSFTQFITQANDKLSVTTLLILRKGQNTSQIILLRRHLFLGKISNNMSPKFIHLANDIKVERVNVIIQRLVIEKQLCQKAQILTVNSMILPI